MTRDHAVENARNEMAKDRAVAFIDAMREALAVDGIVVDR